MTHWTVSTDSSRTTHGTLHVDNHRVATAGPLDEIILRHGNRAWLHLELLDTDPDDDDELWHLSVGERSYHIRVHADGAITVTRQT